ncbi:hypothetical protein VE03_10313, partial [Pseudogymnoascus sp. 23342-1-I1]
MALNPCPPARPYSKNIDTAAEAAKKYNQIAGHYDIITKYHEEDIDEVISIVRPDKNDRCLDLGCGTGMVAYALKQKVREGISPTATFLPQSSSLPEPTSSTPATTASPTSPTQNDARLALETLLNYMVIAVQQGLINEAEYQIANLTERMRGPECGMSI